MIRSALFILLVSSGVQAQNRPYSPAAGESGSDAVSANSAACISWANEVVIERGTVDISQPGAPLANAGDRTFALGKADGACVSLGDGGIATLTFAEPLQDRPGFDFAIFENGFYSPMDTGYFLELGIVEVSSNGIDFVRFPAHSLTSTDEPLGSFGTIDPTQINNLAGKYKTGYGTPFDLAVLDGNTALDLNAITHVRVIDVVGSIDSAYGTQDTAGNFISDPWPTDFPSCGFDLDAVCALNEALSTEEEILQEILSIQTVWSESMRVNARKELAFELYDSSGRILKKGQFQEGVSLTDVSHLVAGVYLLRLINEKNQQVYKCIKR